MMKTNKKYIVLLLNWLLVAFIGIAQAQDINQQRLQEVVGFLASDELQGRKPGLPEDLKSAYYILGHFRNAGLYIDQPHGLQAFDVVIGAEPGMKNSLGINDVNLGYSTDFVTLSFSGNANASGNLVFAGFGFNISNDTLQWNDWEGLEAEGKWALIFRGSPDQDNPNSPFAPLASERDKVMIARDHGVIGVIFVNGPTFQPKDALMDMFFDKSPTTADIPVFQVSREIAEKWFENNQLNLEQVEKHIIENKVPQSSAMNQWVDGNSEVQLNRTPTHNVLGLLPGNDPLLKHEYIIIGAHYDHLGMGGPGTGSRRPDTMAVHNGADDNASGVAGIIELAYQFAASKSNKRSLLFIAFGAEEMGLLGSRYFVDNPIIPMQNIVAMVNFDMIGRLQETRSLLIGGTGTALESEGLLNELKANHKLELALSPEGFGASDHAAFYAKDVPVFFLSTGAHDDYHTPADDISTINFSGQKDVMQFSYSLVDELTKMPARLTFQESGPKSRPSHGRGYKVTLGIMPDFAGTASDGLRVDAVRPEGPAGLGGMKKGDLITAINGMKVTNIYDYMARLKALENGQSINVDVLREGKPQVLIIQI